MHRGSPNSMRGPRRGVVLQHRSGIRRGLLLLLYRFASFSPTCLGELRYTAARTLSSHPDVR